MRLTLKLKRMGTFAVQHFTYSLKHVDQFRGFKEVLKRLLGFHTLILAVPTALLCISIVKGVLASVGHL